MRYAILTLIVSCVGLAPVLTRAQQRGDNSKAAEFARMTAEAVGIDYCTKTIDENWQEQQSRLKVRFHFTNLGTRPLIVYRYAPATYDVRLGKTLADIQKGQFLYAVRPPFPYVPTRNFEAAELTNLFRVVQPNESFTYEDSQTLTFVRKSSEKILLQGDYFLQLKVATWVWEIEKAEKLQQRWAKYGDFFYYNVTAEAFPFTINEPKDITARCDTQ